MMCAIQQTADRFEARSWWHCVALLQLLLQWRRTLPAPNMAAALTSAPFNSSLGRGDGGGGGGWRKPKPKSAFAHATGTTKHVNE